uniref:Uncharacterized protein n=1 Tax=Arundo donax TaxID=35708 RepID=A0A0A9ALL8_ARUDO
MTSTLPAMPTPACPPTVRQNV